MCFILYSRLSIWLCILIWSFLAAGSEYAIYSARNALALDTRLLNRSRTVFKFKRAVLQFRLDSLAGEFLQRISIYFFIPSDDRNCLGRNGEGREKWKVSRFGLNEGWLLSKGNIVASRNEEWLVFGASKTSISD